MPGAGVCFPGRMWYNEKNAKRCLSGRTERRKAEAGRKQSDNGAKDPL